MLPSNVAITLENLKGDPELAPYIKQWLTVKDGPAITREDLLRVHSPEYVDTLYSDRCEAEVIKTYELIDEEGNYHRYNPENATRPLTELFGYALGTVAGSYECCRQALLRGYCFYMSGGMHHGKRDTGDGFCLVNDVVLAPRRIQAEGLARNIWIIDLDVHKGDGTAALTAGDPTIRTLSTHMAHGWPLDREQYLPDGSLHPSFVPSDIDIPVDAGEEERYLPRLSEGLERMLTFGLPDLAIVLYGADSYEGDELPSAQLLKLTADQIARRDQMVYTFLRDRGVPRAYLKAGGYGHHAWNVLTPFLRWYLLLERPWES